MDGAVDGGIGFSNKMGDGITVTVDVYQSGQGIKNSLGLGTERQEENGILSQGELVFNKKIIARLPSFCDRVHIVLPIEADIICIYMKGKNVGNEVGEISF